MDVCTGGGLHVRGVRLEKQVGANSHPSRAFVLRSTEDSALHRNTNCKSTRLSAQQQCSSSIAMLYACFTVAQRARMQVEESMNWAMHVPSLTVAQRCLHVARALTPPLSPSLVLVLLNALLQCYMHPSITAFDFTSQVRPKISPFSLSIYPSLVCVSKFGQFCVRNGLRNDTYTCCIMLRNCADTAGTGGAAESQQPK